MRLPPPILLSLTSVFALISSAQAETLPDYSNVIPLFSSINLHGDTVPFSKCSGTWIHPRLLLTAAHCVAYFQWMKVNGKTAHSSDASNHQAKDVLVAPEQVIIYTKGWLGWIRKSPIRVHVSPRAIPTYNSNLNFQGMDQDLAVLEFDDDLGIARPLAQKEPQPGTPVMIVGFSARKEFAHDWWIPVDDLLRSRQVGSNTLLIQELDNLVVTGPADESTHGGEPPQKRTLSEGDSGGPLLDAATGEILGVASRYIKCEDPRLCDMKVRYSLFTNITSGPGAAFVKQVLQSVSQPKP